VLLDTIYSIIDEQGEFPSESNVRVYAVREFDGDTEANTLVQLLSELDELINSESDQSLPHPNENPDGPIFVEPISESSLPVVVYQLAEVLHTFEGDGLEAQLQTFDVFLANANEDGKSVIVQLLYSAADKAISPKERLRIKEAAMSVQNGGNAAAPYNHEQFMKKYLEEFKKGYSDLGKD
jgi:hypothetical protein